MTTLTDGAIVDPLVELELNDLTTELASDGTADPLLAVGTDQLDYAPGSTATVTATGVEPGGTVEFEVEHVASAGDDGIFGTVDDVTVDLGGEGHDPWIVTDGGEGDLDGEANGIIVTQWYVNPDDSANERFLLSAVDVDAGADGVIGTSDDVGGEPAYATFTDTVVDLTTSGATGTIGIGQFLQSGAVGSSGTGLIQAFVRVQATGTEEGYNTDARGVEFDENSSPSFTKSLLLSDVPIVDPDAIAGSELFLEFRLDINQQSSDPLLSLNRLQLYLGNDPDLTLFNRPVDAGADGFGADSIQLYDMDAIEDSTILLNYNLEPGSGKSDMFFYVPVSVLYGADGVPGGTGANADIDINTFEYVYLYSEFGTTSAVYNSNDGFEEWSVSKQSEFNISGYKWKDTDGDGDWDDGELGLGGWTILVDYDQDNVWDGFVVTSDGTTDANGDGVTDGLDLGYYEIPVDLPDLPQGNPNLAPPILITIGELLQTDWVNTYGGTLEDYEGDGVIYSTLEVELPYLKSNGDPQFAVPAGESGVAEPLNFGNAELGTKEGRKYEDLNADGDDEDGGDPGLAGWTIAAFTDVDGDGFLSDGDTLYDSDVTLADGSYSLTLKPGQQYIIVEQISDQPATWSESPDGDALSVNTFDADYGQYGYVVTLDSGETESNNDFGNYEPGTKEGRKYEDLNADGDDEDGGDPGLAGWTIAAFTDVDGDGFLSDGDTLYDSDVTLADGSYSLTLKPGQQYIIVEQISDQPATWSESPDGDALSVNTFDADYGQYGYVVTLDSGETESNNDFGNYEPGTKEGRKYEDLNADGDDEDGGDPGLAGWTIAAFTDVDGDGFLSDGDTLYDSDVTLADGSYSLTLKPGQQYIIVEQISDQPATWSESPDGDALSVNTFDADYGQYGYVVTLDSGETESNNDFGNYEPGTKEGRKYEDLNADGDDEDGGDPGLAGWTIAAFTDVDGDGFLSDGDTLYDSDVTLADGSYSLTLKPGQQYIIVEQISDQPATWSESPDGDALSVNTFDADYGQYGYVVTLDSGETESNNDFGNYEPGTKEGRKYEDLNADGDDEDGGDPGLAGWTIAAFTDVDGDGFLSDGDTLYDSDVTLADGSYSLTLKPGQQYIIVEQISDQPATWSESPDGDALSVNTFDADYGQYGYVVTLDSGETESNNDFGNYEPGTKEGRKYEDLNADGDDEDGGDPGLAGWTIAAFTDVDGDGFLSDGDTLYDSDVTLADGSYSLTLKPGQQYIIVEQISDQPATWSESPDGDALSVNTFDADYGQYGYVVTLDSGETESNNDFGNYEPGTKEGRKYEDLNADGDDEDGGDPGLAGWTIAAFTDVDGDGFLSDGDTLYDSDVTLADGSYSLTLKPGQQYIIVEQISDQPATWSESPDGDALSVNTFDADYGQYGYVVTLDSGETESNNDFGNYEPGTKEGRKYEDLNADGDDEDGGDPGLAGWTIAAFTDVDGDGFLSDGDTLYDSDVTLADGSYSLTLKPGQQYIIVEQISDQPATWSESPDGDALSVNTFDADYGQYGYVVTLDSGETESNNDFGNYEPGTKEGRKYEDLNADGDDEDGGDPGLAGWTIAAFTDVDGDGFLSDGDTLYDSDVTLADGSYSLTLKPGQQYIIVEQISDQPATWSESPDGDALSVNTFDADYGQYGYVVTLDSGETESNNDFANHQPTTLGLTPGFWANHLYLWDGVENNGPTDGQGRLHADKLALAGVVTEPEILEDVPTVPSVDGDTKPDLMFEASDGRCLIIEWDDAQEIISSSSKKGGDKLHDFTKFAITTLLNDSGVPDFNAPIGLFPDIADWLLEHAQTTPTATIGDNCYILTYNNLGELNNGASSPQDGPKDGFPTQIKANNAAWQFASDSDDISDDLDIPAGSDIFELMVSLTDSAANNFAVNNLLVPSDFGLLGATANDPGGYLYAMASSVAA